MNYVDIGILVLLVLLSIKGIWQGFIRALVSFIGIAAGIFFASRYFKEVEAFFATHIYDLQTPELNALVGFLVILILIWAGFLLLGEILVRVLKINTAGALDGVLGLVFGFCKAFLVISIIVYGVSQIEWLKDFSQKVKKESKVFTEMESLAVKIMNLENFNIEKTANKDKIDKTIEDVKDKVKESTKEVTDAIESAIKP